MAQREWEARRNERKGIVLFLISFSLSHSRSRLSTNFFEVRKFRLSSLPTLTLSSKVASISYYESDRMRSAWRSIWPIPSTLSFPSVRRTLFHSSSPTHLHYHYNRTHLELEDILDGVRELQELFERVSPEFPFKSEHISLFTRYTAEHTMLNFRTTW